GRIPHTPAKTTVVITARSDRADAVRAQPRRCLSKVHAVTRVGPNQDTPVTCDQIIRSSIQGQRCLAKKQLQNLRGGGASCGRNGSGRAAAIRRRTRRKLGVADPNGNLVDMKPEYFGDDLRQHCANSGPDVLHARQNFDRTVAHDANFAGTIGLYIGAPERLRNSKTPLYRSGVGARCMPSRPADPLGTDAPLLAPNWAQIDPVAQRKRVDGKPLGHLVNCLFNRPGARGVTRPAHRAAWAGVDEHVMLRSLEVGA